MFCLGAVAAIVAAVGLTRGRGSLWLPARLGWAAVLAAIMLGLTAMLAWMVRTRLRLGEADATAVSGFLVGLLPVVAVVFLFVRRTEHKRRPPRSQSLSTFRFIDVGFSLVFGAALPAVIVLPWIQITWRGPLFGAILVAVGFLTLMCLSFLVGRVLWLVLASMCFPIAEVQKIIEMDRPRDPFVPVYLLVLRLVQDSDENRQTHQSA